MSARLPLGVLARSAILAIALGVPCAYAETLYVIEQLVVTVNSAADGAGERVGQIKSGDSVELLERQGDQAHVRLPSGTEGWVKASYLSAAPPMQQQLSARTEELEHVRKEKAQLEADLAAARKALASAATAVPSSGGSSKAAAGKGATVSSTAVASTDGASTAAAGASTLAPSQFPTGADNTTTAEPDSRAAPPLFADRPMMPSRPSWLWAAVSSLISLILGFVLGWLALDRRVRAKFGGLRVY